MRPLSRVLLILGLLSIIAAAGWRATATGRLVTHPDEAGQVRELTGEVVLLVEPGTITAAAQPARLPLTISETYRTEQRVDDTFYIHLLRRRELAGPAADQPPRVRTAEMVYAVRRDGRNVTDRRAYALDPANEVDRAGSFTTGFGPRVGVDAYPVWKDETAVPFGVAQEGTTTSVNGLDVVILSGSQRDTPVAPEYVADLTALVDLPASGTLDQLAGLFGDQDPATDIRGLLRRLRPDDAQALRPLLDEPVPLAPTLDSRTSYLVEPVTGIVVGQTVRETVSLRPELAGTVGRAASILAAEHYRADPDLASLQRGLAGLVTNPPTVRAADISYSTTPASTEQAAAWAAEKKREAQWLWNRLPATVGGIGLLAILAGLVLTARGRRRRRSSMLPSRLSSRRPSRPPARRPPSHHLPSHHLESGGPPSGGLRPGEPRPGGTVSSRGAVPHGRAAAPAPRPPDLYRW